MLSSRQSVDGDNEGEGGEGRGGEEGEEEEDREMDMWCVPLESLGLGGNKIGDVGAQYLASGLASNTSEIHVHLSCDMSCDLYWECHVTCTGNLSNVM